MKIILGLILTPILFVIVGVIGTELNKAYWDRKVRAMCEEDGGVAVFEHIDLPENSKLLNSNKNIIISAESVADYEAPYYVNYSYLIIKEKYPRIRRAITRVVRRSDLEIISQRTNYIRTGGDFPTIISAGSSFSCGSLKDINISLIKSTFSIKGI